MVLAINLITSSASLSIYGVSSYDHEKVDAGIPLYPKVPKYPADREKLSIPIDPSIEALAHAVF